jgi:nitrate reductase NapE component
VQRRALGLLFAVISLGLVAIAAAALLGAHGGARWVIALAALALAAWMGSTAAAALRR